MIHSNNIDTNNHNNTNAYAASSAQHFIAAPVNTAEAHHHHQQQQHQQQKQTKNTRNNNSYSDTAAAYGVNGNTEAASRMVAEANQQKNMMPTYPGLERFTLLEKMGDGAFSNVFKAHDTKTDRVVAIKVVRKFDMNAHQNKHLHRDMKKKPRVTERANILKEVQIMRQLNHPGIVELYDFSESDEYYFLVLELATGGELFHRIVKLTYFSEDLARHVIVQVAQAIRYLHEEKGVIHRDIKPENILFEPIPIIPSPPGYKPDEDKEDEGIFQPGIGGGGIGRVKIADFGLSKVVWDEHTMTPCGTVGYTAPEIVKDERYSKSVDMWALGCVLYTLLVGFPPFYDESIQALTEKVARGQFTFLSPWWDEISSEVKDLISHLLCVNPHERYTIDQFLAHPWIKAGEQPMAKDAVKSTIPEISVASPMFAENKILAGNPLSPGVGLKEVFDVSNAVHRMGEESRRRHTPQPGGHQSLETRQRQAFMTQLNEEDEEGEHSDESGSGSNMSEDEVIAASMDGVRINGQEQKQDMGVLHRQQKEYQRAQEQIAAENHSKYLRQQQQAGVAVPSHHISSSSKSGGYSSGTRSGNTTSTSTSTSTTSSSASRRRRAGFQLNMNQATLLKRRAKQSQVQPQPYHLPPTVECQDQRMSQPSAVAV
ncbi:kinase-like domain-containing protein [Gamsiella multidivaricata]|uniref:kinase-like domain-containing protein n=1 Tax=Gamsiella multidivaricata TaxID=101098 RepID=UPI00221FAA1A|nr:kinase-like domain-containing protein [Gamsiella multidivaricata]KAI7818246.1 kinase-like domain-containing protein [Gamsiella multidivaricata]